MGVCEKKTRGEGDFYEGDEGWGGGSGRIEARWVRERERAERESRGVKCFGKWFTEIFFVNRFPNFSEGFSGQIQSISVDFYFIAK